MPKNTICLWYDKDAEAAASTSRPFPIAQWVPFTVHGRHRDEVIRCTSGLPLAVLPCLIRVNSHQIIELPRDTNLHWV